MKHKNRLRNRYLRVTFLVLLLVLTALTGCQKAITLHPIEQSDIIQVKGGETLVAPKDGYFLSDMYVNEVVQAKVE